MEKGERLTKEEKIEFLTRIVEGEDYSTDYWPVLRDYLEDEDAEVRSLPSTGCGTIPCRS